MSKTDVTRFVNDVKANGQLQNDLINRVDISDIVEIGNKHGYHFTEQDIREYAEQQKAGLTEKELAAVAGGLATWPQPSPVIHWFIIIL